MRTNSKILDLSRKGKNLRLHIAMSDVLVSRPSLLFQASKCIISQLMILQCCGFKLPMCMCIGSVHV